MTVDEEIVDDHAIEFYYREVLYTLTNFNN